MNLYPFKFHPILKERIWGGSRLKDVLNKPLQSDGIGESWELSGVEGDVSVIANGPLAGRSLNELLADYGAEVLGKSVVKRSGTEFPVLIKFLDANQDLSIQVHPNDRLARERHNSNGKTEMWYIMDAERDAKLIIGFNHDVTREEFLENLKEDTLPALLHYEPVDAGDAFMINAGRIHAIGAGVLLAEIQQTSDITYRVFDFNRRDKNGNLRELHTDLALDAMDYKQRQDFKLRYSKKADRINEVVDSPYFRTSYLDLTKDFKQDISGRDSFTILMCVAGDAEVSNEEGSAAIRSGETILVPACSNTLQLKTLGARFLEITI